jgi:hypothetical protein
MRQYVCGLFYDTLGTHDKASWGTRSNTTNDQGHHSSARGRQRETTLSTTAHRFRGGTPDDENSRATDVRAVPSGVPHGAEHRSVNEGQHRGGRLAAVMTRCASARTPSVGARSERDGTAPVEPTPTGV